VPGTEKNDFPSRKFLEKFLQGGVSAGRVGFWRTVECIDDLREGGVGLLTPTGENTKLKILKLKKKIDGGAIEWLHQSQKLSITFGHF